MEHRLGLIVNPIAGMGGSVGLKGTDGKLAAVARKLGASPVASERARKALSELGGFGGSLEIFTCAGGMGADAAALAGIEPTVLTAAAGRDTNAADTRAGAMAIVERGPDLLLFVGGDGTARDVLEVIGRRVPVLGVPSGVKMHSAVFAASARAAGEIAARFLRARDRQSLLGDAEILDRDANGAGGASPRLYGIMRTPRPGFLVPGAKASSPVSEQAALDAAIARVVARMDDSSVSLLGPGSTMQLAKRQFGFDGTLLGVDAVRHGSCLATDIGEREILQLLDRHGRGRIVVSVVGGQGFLFGRGNQQLSARVIGRVGKANIDIVSSLEKLTALPWGCLLVDTGDEALDAELSGHMPVIVSGNRTAMMPIRSTSAASAPWRSSRAGTRAGAT